MQQVEGMPSEFQMAKSKVVLTQRPSPLLTQALLMGVDLTVSVAAFAGAILIRDSFAGFLLMENYISVWPLLLLFPLSYAVAGLYQFGLASPEELRRLTITTTLNFIAIGAATFLWKVGVLYSRGVFLMAYVFILLGVPLARALVKALFSRQGWWGRGAIILGAGKSGELLVKVLKNQPSIGLKPLAVLDDDPQKHGKTIEGVSVMGDLSLAEAYAQQGVDYAIFAMPGLPRQRMLHLVERYSRFFPHLLLIPDLFGFSSLWVQAQDLGGVLGLEVRQQLLSPWPQMTKRMMDIGLIMACSPLILVLGLLIALAIRVDSPGPIFYKNRRFGRWGKLFYMWKFRSMVVNAEQVLLKYLDEHPQFRKEWEENLKLKNDPRITRIGKWLRKFSLDELPQLWNVLRGEMSLVGPRPFLEEQTQLNSAHYEIYRQVLPGITGLWQVSGRNEITLQERAMLDAYYVRNWSLWLDLVILAKTVWVVLSGKGAY